LCSLSCGTERAPRMRVGSAERLRRMAGPQVLPGGRLPASLLRLEREASGTRSTRADRVLRVGRVNEGTGSMGRILRGCRYLSGNQREFSGFSGRRTVAYGPGAVRPLPACWLRFVPPLKCCRSACRKAKHSPRPNLRCTWAAARPACWSRCRCCGSTTPCATTSPPTTPSRSRRPQPRCKLAVRVKMVPAAATSEAVSGPRQVELMNQA
jgi:hypothetical protein